MTFADTIADLMNGQKHPVASIFAPPAKKSGALLGRRMRMGADLEVLSRLNDPMNTYVRLPFDVHFD